MRAPVFRPLLVVAAALALCPAGCLDFEKQTFVLTFHPERDEINALLLYEGLQVAGKTEEDRKTAEKSLGVVFAESKGFYLGHPIAGFGLAPDNDQGASEKEKKLLDLMVKHLTVRKGTVFLNKEGSLCGSQEITIRQARAFVRGLNEMISAEVGSMAEKALADATKKQQGFFDEETLKLMQKAVKDKHQWIHFEPGRLSVTLVGSPKYFAKAKQELTNDLILRDLRRMAGMPARPGQPPPFERDKPPPFERDKPREKEPDGPPPRLPRPPGPNADPKQESRPVDPAYVQHKMKEAERFAELVSETPWGVEQRRNRFTFSLGVGEGEPLRFFSPYVSETEQGNQAAALVAHARTLGLEIKKDATAESVVAEFLRRHGPKKKE
jgi:hypothetical protein